MSSEGHRNATGGEFVCVCERRFVTLHGLRQHQDSHCKAHIAKVREEADVAEAGEDNYCVNFQPSEGGPEIGHQQSEPTMLRLARLRTVHGVGRGAMMNMKQIMREQVETLRTQVQARLEEQLGHQEFSIDELVQSVFETAADLGARDAELDLLRGSEAYVKPVRRYLGTCPNSGEAFYAYDSPLDKNLEGLFKAHWNEIKASAAKMQPEAGWEAAEFSEDLFISDVWDGVEFKRFMAKVAARPGQTPLVFMFYYDGLEVVNGLGQARTTHELGCFYWTLLNIGQEKRLSDNCIRLATVCYKRGITICGMDKVVAGPSADGDGPASWVEWMRALDKGLTLKTPDGDAFFRGGTALVAADTPAAAELMGTKKAVGPSTKSICRNCHCSQAGGAHRKPCSFLASLPGSWKRRCAGRRTPFKLRTTQDLQEYIRRLGAVQGGQCAYAELQEWMQLEGVNSFHGALWQMPHFSQLTGCPMDTMHIWLEGVGRQGLGAVSFWLKRECKADLFQIPKYIHALAKEKQLSVSNFPHLNTTRIKHLGEGMEGGLPSTDCSFPGTAAQVGHMQSCTTAWPADSCTIAT